MGDPHFQVIRPSAEAEDDLDQPVPASELQELDEEKRILSSVYRHVEHQQAVEQVAGVAGAISEVRAMSESTNESKSPSSPWMTSLTQKTPSLPISVVGSEGSESISGGLHIRMSVDAGSIEAGDGRGDTVQELLSIPPSLDAALRLNMALQRRFRERIQKLEMVFMKNLDRQEKLRDEISNAKWVREQDQKTDGSGKVPLRISHFCVPYFKNRSGMPAPMNDDAKMKVKTGYIDLYVTRPRTWLTVERETLDETVRKEWREHNISSCETAIRELQRKLRNLDPEEDEGPVKQIEDEMKSLNESIKNLEIAPLHNIMPDRAEKLLDWDRIAARAFDGHRTSDECRLQWENLLHPVVNTEPFTENEDLIIQKLIMNSRSKVPDWDRIAFELRTSRATFQVMQRYVSFIEPTMKPKRWTKRDSDKLLHTINMLRVGTHIPWAQVHQHLVGFSRAQIQSRWRMIDPEISKGPFTVEEDFILIKGLHMFGLNFDSISHFMPGRTFPQVRDRYKRTILPGLALKPWKKEEDAIIIKECSVGSRNWRKMIMQLPRFDACQIRSRYHIIQVWQTISGTNMVPPPLFPVTAAVKPDTIQEIRNAMIMEACNLKQLVDESRKGIRLKNVVKELEERRLIIKERKSHNNLQRMKKLTEKRGRQAGTPNPHYKPMQDIFLTEFFVPFRHSSVFPTLQFGNVVHSLKDLCKVLQLRILKQVTEDEATQLSLLRLTPSDLEIVKDLAATHERTIGRCCASNCPTCEPAQPERIPLLPPCKTTLGTFRSILVHRPKLSEMANGEFFLHKYSRNELLRLESNCKGKRKRQSNFTLHETATGSGQSQPGNVSEGDVSQDESDAVLQVDVVEGPSAKFSQAKFHITTLVDVSDKQKKGPSKVKRPPLTDATQGVVKAYSRGKIVKCEPVDVPCSNVPNIKLEVNGQEVQSIEEIHNRSSRPLSAENEKASKASESLLFHRMLSIFYWPAMMTLALPPQDLINQINEKIESGDLQKPPNTTRADDADKAKKPKSKDDLGIEEQVKYIEELNEKETEHQTQTGRRKGKRKYQKKGQLKKKVSVEATTSDTNCQVDDDDEETTLKEEEDRAASVVQPNEEEEEEDAGEAAHKKVDGRVNNKGLASHYRKRSLKSLRRSLVMKRIWDARRNGSYPQRTSDRDTRNYNPRASRTRNRVRKDMIKRPKSPRPWELPLDGPLRVQPQVPFIPSQEMLAFAFSESASTSTTTLTEDHPVGNLKAPEDVPQHSSKVETKVVRSKKLDPQEHREVPSQIRGSSTRTSTGSEGVKNETEARSKTSLDIKGKGQKRRKFVHSEAKVVEAPVEVHATMTDEPRENLLSKSAPETNNSSKTVADTATTKNKPKMSLLKSVTTQPRSQVTPPSGSIDDVPESSVTETLVPDLEGVTEAKEVDTRPSLTPERVTQPLCKRPFEASFQNLLDDAVEIGESGGEKRTYFGPEEAINRSEIVVVPQTREKRIKKPSYKKSYQVSFQSLLDDPVEAHNSSLPMAISPDLSSDLPVKIQPLVRGASRKGSCAKPQRKPPGSQVKVPSVTSGDESRVASPKGQIDGGYTTALISSDKQLSCQTRVLLHQLPQDVVQPLLTDKPPLMDESRP